MSCALQSSHNIHQPVVINHPGRRTSCKGTKQSPAGTVGKPIRQGGALSTARHVPVATGETTWPKCVNSINGELTSQGRYTLQEGTDSEEEQDTLFLAPLFIGNLEEGSQWQEDIDVGQMSIRFKLDTGANANVIPYQTYLRVQKSDGNKGTVALISSTRSILTGIGNGKIRPRGLSFTARWWEEKGSPGNHCHSMSRMKSWSS